MSHSAASDRAVSSSVASSSPGAGSGAGAGLSSNGTARAVIPVRSAAPATTRSASRLNGLAKS